MALCLTLAGRVALEADGVAVSEGGLGRLGRLALAYLACERQRPVGRDELAEVLWGDALPRSWEQLLRGIASKLRTALATAGLDPAVAITTAFGAYQMHLPTDTRIDIEDAWAAFEAGQRALDAGDAERASEAAAVAVAVAARQFLPGSSGPWVERRQVELVELHLRGLEVLALAAQARGRWDEAVAVSEEAVAIEPYRESAYQHLMAAHAGAGNRGKALQAYERCRRTLADELGVNPSPSTEAAYLDLLGDEPAVVAPPAATTAALPLPLALLANADTFLVGREVEAGRLVTALRRAPAEGRQAVFVGGEPGIGKTALTMAFGRAAHSQGARVLYGRCDEGLGVAYQPFAEAIGHYVATCPSAELAAHVARHGGELARLTPELNHRLPATPPPPIIAPEADRFRLFEAVSGLLTSAADVAPLVVVLDDLQWAAGPTLLLVRHLLRSTGPAAALVVVGTYRHSELGPTHPLTSTLADLRREPGVERMTLQGLDSAGVAEFLEAAEGRPSTEESLALSQAIHAHTSGNPFFVGELWRHLAESGAVYRREGAWSYYADSEGSTVPDGVKEVVARRLHRLSPSANRALVWASVVGVEFDLKLLEQVDDGPEADDALAAIEEAVSARLVVELGLGHYGFAHALVRDTIYSSISPTRQGRLHRVIGEAMESLPGDDGVRLPSLAYNFARAAADGCATKAADYARDAAHLAFTDGAWEDAAALLERGLHALDLHSPPDPVRRCELLLLLAEAWIRFWDITSATAAAIRAVEAARAVGSPEALGQAVRWYLAAAAGPHVEIAVSLGEEAVDALGATNPVLRATLMARLALQAAVNDHRVDVVEAKTLDAVKLARSTGDPAPLGVALLARSWALAGSVRPQEWLDIADELVTAAPADGWDGWRNGHNERARARMALGDRTGYEADIAEMERMGAQRRFWVFEWLGAGHRAALALLDGQFDDVEGLATVARESAKFEGAGAPAFNNHLFALRFEQGRLGEWSEAAGVHPICIRQREALLYAELGELEDARRVFESFADDGLVPVVGPARREAIAHRSEVIAALADTERAARLYEIARPYAGQMVESGMVWPGAVDRYLGMLAFVTGGLDKAESHFQAALAMETGVRSPPLVARTSYWYGRMLLSRGGPGDDQTFSDMLATSMITAQRCGMAGLARRGGLLLAGP